MAPHALVQTIRAKGGLMNDLDTLKVSDAMHEGVYTCSLYAPLSTVARIMAAHRVHAVVVWNEPGRGEAAELWGVVSDLDLVKLAATEDLHARTAGGSAATPALMISPHDSLARAAQLMTEHEVAHLVVVDPGTTRPVGVISTLDLADSLAGIDAPVVA
jgi:CBS domain-containing protein